VRFGEGGDFCEHGHRFLGEFTNGGFAREHDGVSAVENGIGDVGGFGASGEAAGNHGLEHLRRGDNGFAGATGAGDQLFLPECHFFDRDFHAEIAAGDHNAVGGAENLVKIGQETVKFRTAKRLSQASNNHPLA